jgi:hypothetical protein
MPLSSNIALEIKPIDIVKNDIEILKEELEMLKEEIKKINIQLKDNSVNKGGWWWGS